MPSESRPLLFSIGSHLPALGSSQPSHPRKLKPRRHLRKLKLPLKNKRAKGYSRVATTRETLSSRETRSANRHSLRNQLVKLPRAARSSRRGPHKKTRDRKLDRKHLTLMTQLHSRTLNWIELFNDTSQSKATGLLLRSSSS